MKDRRRFQRVELNQHTTYIVVRTLCIEAIHLNQSRGGAGLRYLYPEEILPALKINDVIHISSYGLFPDKRGLYVDLNKTGIVKWFDNEKKTMGIEFKNKFPEPEAI